MGVVRLGVTLGDPRGIGPEVAFRAAEGVDEFELIFFGPEGLREAAPSGFEYVVTSPHDGTQTELPDAEAGTAALAAIREATRRACDGTLHGVVTAPVHKPSLASAGAGARGHTEILKELSGAPEVGMLMAAERTTAGGPLRVLLATIHVPLRAVPHLLTVELLEHQTRLLDGALRRDWRLDGPRIALCALNPHASDGGLFGHEERTVLEPAVQALRDEGLDVTGPLPADTVFARALSGAFDAVVAPYHDVGMAAFKTVTFGRGVNVTLGLPFVRTSPDHGTAFDLAGTGRADASSMAAAIRLAGRLARNRFDSGSAGV